MNVTEVRYSDLKKMFSRNFQFHRRDLTSQTFELKVNHLSPLVLTVRASLDQRIQLKSKFLDPFQSDHLNPYQKLTMATMLKFHLNTKQIRYRSLLCILLIRIKFFQDR